MVHWMLYTYGGFYHVTTVHHRAQQVQILRLSLAASYAIDRGAPRANLNPNYRGLLRFSRPPNALVVPSPVVHTGLSVNSSLPSSTPSYSGILEALARWIKYRFLHPQPPSPLSQTPTSRPSRPSALRPTRLQSRDTQPLTASVLQFSCSTGTRKSIIMIKKSITTRTYHCTWSKRVKQPILRPRSTRM